MKDHSKLEQKIDLLYKCIHEEGGIIDFDWCTGLLYPYYYHFDEKNLRYRSASLIAFLGLLTEWEDGSGFPFFTGDETYECHDFEQYMDRFLEHSKKIETDLPNTFYSIVITLLTLFYHNGLETVFQNIDKQKLSRYVSVINGIEVKRSSEVFKLAFQEAGIFN